MSAQTVKQEVLKSLQRLPEDSNIDEMMYRLYVIDKLHKSREAVQLGEVVSQEELTREMEQW